MEYTEAEKREAFAAFDDYVPRFKATMAGFVPGVAHDRTLLDNPLVGMIYADGFLHGRHSGDKEERISAAELQRRGERSETVPNSSENTHCPKRS